MKMKTFAEYPEIGGSTRCGARSESDGGALTKRNHCRRGGRDDGHDWTHGLLEMTERIRVWWAKIGFDGGL